MPSMNPSLREMQQELSVGEEFVTRYNRPGPRYTSYPTAPVWNDAYGPNDFEAAMRTAEAKRSPVSLYMHLPFCESLCLFCACNVIIRKDKSGTPPYLNILKKEIDHIASRVSRDRHVSQFHWGGGTPTYLSPEQIEELFVYTRDRFHFAPDAEIGIEVDPRVTSRAHMEILRLSMGVQDFKEDVQKAIHRIQPYEQTRDLIAIARELGFDSINVDLIYGLPFQTAESFAHTVEQIVSLSPDRIAMFSYAHVPWLKKQQGSFVAHLPEGMKKFDIFRSGLLKFLEAGYLYVGMDHFAKENDELAVSQRNRTLHRNFQGYTTKAGADLYGMGVSAISSIQNTYAQNHRAVPAYQEAVEKRGLATMRGYKLSFDDRVRRAVVSRLLCHTVIPKNEVNTEFRIMFDEYFGAELKRLVPFQEDGLVHVTADEIRTTWLGRIFIRNVAMVFDTYLEKQQLSAKPLFSKTL